jgi:hypothetical protein
MISVCRYLAIISLAFVISGCTSMIRSIGEADIQSVRKVVVVSQLGNTFTGSLTATTVFGNSSYKVDVSDWQVDQKLVASAVDVINQGVKITASALVSNASVKELLQAAAAQNADTLLLVQLAGNSNQPEFRPGYGFHRRKLFNIDRSCIYSLFVTAAYDVKSGNNIGIAWSFPKWESIPCQQNTDLVWKDSFTKYSPEEKELIRKAVIASVTNNVKTSLKGLGLVP